MKVAIIDVGIANTGSVVRVLQELGATPQIVKSPDELGSPDRIILPGVGNFATAMAKLNAAGLVSAVKDTAAQGIPVMGICLGMQLLADLGTESGETEGFGLIPGTVARLDQLGCKERIPHMGWNALHIQKASPLLKDIPEATDFYFVHSFAFSPSDESHVLATTDYGCKVTAIVQNGNVCGAQFHPEKSSKMGFKLIQNFLENRLC